MGNPHNFFKFGVLWFLCHRCDIHRVCRVGSYVRLWGQPPSHSAPSVSLVMSSHPSASVHTHCRTSHVLFCVVVVVVYNWLVTDLCSVVGVGRNASEESISRKNNRGTPFPPVTCGPQHWGLGSQCLPQLSRLAGRWFCSPDQASTSLMPPSQASQRLGFVWLAFFLLSHCSLIVLCCNAGNRMWFLFFVSRKPMLELL